MIETAEPHVHDVFGDAAPAVDVIIPALDAAATLDSCLDAVLDQDYAGSIAVTSMPSIRQTPFSSQNCGGRM